MMTFKGGDRSLTKGQRWYRRNKKYYRDWQRTERRKEWRRQWYHKNARKQKENVLRKRYGITLEDFERMLLEQNGVCAICRSPESVVHRKSGKVQPLSVDHCHRTGKVRGLLCVRCNHTLGRCNDDPVMLRRAVEYLERSLIQEDGSAD